ncbi:hypothetical protein V5O48_006344 [Marasmius crinis-equi]|uniref:DJ-1/PfpI domain-containing protein n=1 Tax=Marasmius crinis-equi TaxID=585013 RepID=A0ABR3FJR2_9AGAR
MSSPAPPTKVYRMAVCLFPLVTMTDFQAPVELLGAFSTPNRKVFGHLYSSLPDCAIDPEYLSHTLEPVAPAAGPAVNPTMTYEDAMKVDFDIIFVPGGINPPETSHPSCSEFIKQKGPKAQYLLTVCTGSWLVARTGLLTGKRATTNKALYKHVVEDTKEFNVEWVPKARWVMNDDKHIWTSSGVTAGIDLAYAFLKHLVGEKFADELKGIAELSTKENSDDDEFAARFGLV